MKKIPLLALLLICVLVAPHASNAQFDGSIPSAMTGEEIVLLQADLKARMERPLPMEESDLVDERDWIRQTKSRADRTRLSIENQKGTGIAPQKDLDNLEAELLSIMQMVKQVDCANADDARAKLKQSHDAFHDLRSGYSHILDVSSGDGVTGSQDWVKVESRFNELTSLFDGKGGKPVAPFTQGSCEGVVKLFNQPSFRSDIDTYFTKKGQEYSILNQTKLDGEKALSELGEELAQYDNMIDEALKDARTKRTALDNLFIIVAILVVLSVGSIAIIRIFPYELMREWIESGQVIQFVTVTIILIVIVVLGLTGLLTENSLGTLLGGIGGYVLSQGVGRAAAKNAIRNKKKKEEESEVREVVKELEKEGE